MRSISHPRGVTGRSRSWLFLPVLLLLGVPSCGEVRAPTATRPALTATYLGQIKPLLDRRCATSGCHQGPRLAGRYDLSSYTGLLGPGTDLIRNAIAGDAKGSLLYSKLDATKEAKHWGYLLPNADELKGGETPEARRVTDLELLRSFIETDGLAYFDVLVHPASWVYPGDCDSLDFHGGALRKLGWDTTSCQECHGKDLLGGESQKSCWSCHYDGPGACTTCHGSRGRTSTSAAAPPSDLSWKLSPTAKGVGAHQKHLGSSTAFPRAQCSDCHVVPRTMKSKGHLDNADLKAEVTFSGQASRGGAKATYDSTKQTCSGVYCHGGTLNDTTAKPVSMAWNEQPTVGCDSCHGLPGKGLGGPECHVCHSQAVAACTPGTEGCFKTGTRASDGKDVGVRFLQNSHIDGKVSVGKAGAKGACDGCHGTGSEGAPPPDLDGSKDPSDPGVGLHAEHLKGSKLARARVCGDCHLVPKKVTDTGHLDSDGVAEVTFSDRAKGKTASSSVDLKPTYSSDYTCSSTYCHSLDGAEAKTWTWTKSQSLSCTSCHGQPPTKTAAGAPHTSNTSCPVCHSSAYTSTGSLDPNRHINGKVDL